MAELHSTQNFLVGPEDFLLPSRSPHPVTSSSDYHPVTTQCQVQTRVHKGESIKEDVHINKDKPATNRPPESRSHILKLQVKLNIC